MRQYQKIMKERIVCIGEILVDFVAPEKNVALIEAKSFRPCAGGAPANVAVGIARLGGAATFLSCVGQDCWGEYLRKELEAEGVDVSGVQVTTEASTTLAFVSLFDGGERDFSFIRSPGADTKIETSKLTRAPLENCAILHFGTVSMTAEPSGQATRDAVGLARESGAAISLDVNYRANLWTSPQAAIECVRELLPSVDILKLSEEEAELVTSRGDLKTASMELLAMGPRVVLISLGAEGCVCAFGDSFFKVSAFPAACLDATGAGDSFMAGFLQRFFELKMRFEDRSVLEDACRFACAAASHTVQGYGAIPSLPFLVDVEGCLQRSRSAEG